MCPIPRAGPVLPSSPRNVHIRENTLQRHRRCNKEQVNEKLWSREINFSPLLGSCFWNTCPEMWCSAQLGGTENPEGHSNEQPALSTSLPARVLCGFAIHGLTKGSQVL